MIDFEKAFQTFIKVWMEREGLSKSDYDLLDDRLPDIYDEWLNTPSKTFGDKTPMTFFDDIDNPFSLMRMLKKYVAEGITVPGPLLNRMVDLSEGIYLLVIDELENNISGDAAKDKLDSLYIELICEMKKPHPLSAYIKTITMAEGRRESLEAMIDVLKNHVNEVKDEIKTAYLSTAHEYAKDSFLDILSLLVGDEDAYKFTLECFIYDISKCGMYAHMLSKIGNPECTPYLEERLKDPTVNYFNFCRVKEALEELGGETTVDREFVGDEDFDYMAELNIEDNNEETEEENFE